MERQEWCTMIFRLLLCMGVLISLGTQGRWGGGLVLEKQAVSLAFQTVQSHLRAREVQAASVTLDHLGLTALKLSRMQILRKHLDQEECWNKSNIYILGAEVQGEMFLLDIHFMFMVLVFGGGESQDQRKGEISHPLK